MKLLSLILLLAVSGLGQSVRHDYAGPNYTTAPSTAPFRVVASAPATCTTNQWIWRSDESKLYRCSATNTWTEFAGSGGATAGYGILTEGSAITYNPVDPRYVTLIDEFLAPSASGGSYGVGTLNWRHGNNGTCTGSVETTLTFTNPGQFKTTTGASAGNGCWLNHQATAYGPTFGSVYASSANVFDMVWILKINRTTDIRLYVGLQGLYNGDPPGDKGFYFRYSTTASDTNFMAVSLSSSTETAVSTGVAADADTFHVFRIYSDGATANKLFYSIDGGTAKTVCASGCDITTNISTTGVMEPFAAAFTTSSTAAILTVDAFLLRAKVSATAGRRN